MRMSVKLHFVVWAALLGIVCVTSAQCQRRPLSIVISAPQSVLRVGSEVRLEVTLTNTSSRRMLIQERNSATDYEIDVRDERGTAVPENDYGRKLKEPPVMPMNSRNFGIYLQPNESTKESIALSDLYDLSRPGKYSIQVERGVSDNPKDGVVKSNKVILTVRE